MNWKPQFRFVGDYYMHIYFWLRFILRRAVVNSMLYIGENRRDDTDFSTWHNEREIPNHVNYM